MKLSKTKAEYIIRFQNRLPNRAFLIDAMANVADRPIVLVKTTDITKTGKHILTIGSSNKSQTEFDKISGNNSYVDIGDDTPKTNMTDVLKSFEAYDPPPKELPEEYKDSEVHIWRSKTGIEIIHEQESPYELIRNYNNWLLMDDAKKAESDEMCRKLFYYTNVNYFKVMIKQFIEDGKLAEGDIVDLVVMSSKSTCRVFIDSIVGDEVPTSIVFKFLDSGEGRPFGEIDTFELKKGEIENLKEPKIETTVGRFLLNYMLLVKPFGKIIPYWNDKWDIKKTEAIITPLVLNDTISIKQLKQYEDNLFFIGHFSELCVPAFSRASLTTHPDVAKVKKQLLEKYKDQLGDPLIISEIENTLIALDKAHLKNDSAMRFYGALGGKVFDVARKKLFLTVGGIEAFSKDSGKYNFLPNSLDEGWDKKYIPTLANETRKGSYNRGFETQLGGVQTKLITRVFQDVNIYHPDCGTNKGLLVNFSKYPATNFIGRWILNKGKWMVLTDENVSSFKQGEYLMRSPMYCEAPKGLCYKCVGERFRTLDVKQIAVIEIDISSTFLTLSMKNMHGTKLEMFELEDLDTFIVD